ncbi:hypothetical protein AAC387_Pa06g0974 [Persea americana]
MSDEGERTCPLCMEEMDMTDQQLKPCKCGYEICVWCWHHIMDMAEKDDTEGRCPACRTPYDKERIVGMTVNTERLAELNSEKKLKSQKAKSKASEGRKHLSTVRVIQRNLVYIVGIPANLADEETLQRKEFFGQYGKILKVSITRAAGATQHSSSNSCSVYITYSRNEEAIRCIQVVNGYVLDGKPLRACFGTTKYCHSWLRNMPCGNPDCLYLHDAGTQEDTFTKDEAISTCARLQQSPGSALNNFHQRSGSVLPPPLDNFCGNNTTQNKTLVKPVIHNPAVYSKNSVLNGSTGKSGGLPAAASWALRATPNNRPSAINAAVIKGTEKNKPSLTSSLTPAYPEVQIPTQTCSTDQHIEHMVASGNHLPLLSARLDTHSTSELCKKDCQSNLKGAHVQGSQDPTSVLKNDIRESPGFSNSREMMRGTTVPLPCSLDLDGIRQQVPDSKLDMDVPRHPRVVDTTQCSFSGPHSVAEGTSSEFGCLDAERSCLISSCHPNVSGRHLDHPVTSFQDGLIPRLGALNFAPVPGFDLTSSGPSSDERSNLGSEMGIKISPATNLDAKSASVSLKEEEESHYSSGHRVKNMDYEFQSLMSEKNGSALEEPNAERENSLITDILSLHIGLDDPSASPHDIARLLLRDDDKSTGYSKLFNPMKSSSNESRFSFARTKDSEQRIDNSSYTFVTPKNSALHEIVENNVPHVSSNGISVHVSKNSQILDCHHQLSVSEPSALLSGIDTTPRPRSPIQRKAPPVPPPGFNTQHSVDRDQYSLLPSPGSTAQYQFLGSSAGLNSTQQITGNNSYTDVEFIDPAIMAVRGKLPLSMTNVISSNYSPNLMGLSELEQRIQLLMSRSSNLSHSPMMSLDQNKYNHLLQDMALQEVMRNPNGAWGAWNMAGSSMSESGLLARRGQSSLAEITNNGRVGYLNSQYGFLRPFPSHEDTKFQASNSGYFYNSAYDI